MICMDFDHNKRFGLLKFHSGYVKFYFNSQKGYNRKMINAQTGINRIIPYYDINIFLWKNPINFSTHDY